MSDGGDGTAELAVNAPAVVELLVGWPGGALVLDAADAADAHDQDDQHQHKGHAQRPDDDVQGVTRHVGQALCHMPRLPLQMYFTVCTDPSMRTMAGVTTRLIYASSSMVTWVAVTVIYINFTVFTCISRCTNARSIQTFTVTSATVLAVDVNTRIFV